jgi:selenocysteine lyase/cysteine desulfurase
MPAIANSPPKKLRSSFAAIVAAGRFIIFDSAAGAQIPQMALHAVRQRLGEQKVPRGARYLPSRAVDEAIARGRQSAADFVQAKDSGEITEGCGRVPERDCAAS